ncbi:endonuclease domain-containing protein [uncultured Eubacterium sp.]|uniref:endonuclease domain-containing protein n=1 Tax=uncultured Eubacterium sp. TaxID=165185 RepID=UPI0025F1F89C|nr:DUF559 domain-containing protein [uncultured Eubacterium sp.]
MDRKFNSDLVENSRELRKNMTKEERHLWYDFLKDYSVRFKRQKIIGKYIVDFYCATANLVIELDGSQHFEDEAIAYDNSRTEYLESFGLYILRVPNFEINTNFDNVCEYIDALVQSRL